jgi:hypothetical protein
VTVPTLDTATITEQTVAATAAISVSYPSTVNSGDLLLILAVNDDAGGSNYDFTGQHGTYVPSGFDMLTTNNTGNDGCHYAVFWKIADGTETGSVTLTCDAAVDQIAWMCRVTGADNQIPFSATSAEWVSAGTASSHTLNAHTTNHADCLAFYLIAGDGDDMSPFGQPTGWTEQKDATVGSGGSGVSGAWGTKSITTKGTSSGSPVISSNVPDGAAGITFSVPGTISSTISYVGGISHRVAANGDVNMPSGLQEDDIVFCWTYQDGATGTTEGIQGGEDAGTWTEVRIDSSAAPSYELFYKIMGATPDTVVDIHADAVEVIGVSLVAFRGVDTTTPLDDVTVPATATTANSFPDPPTITPNTAGAWVVAFGANDDDATEQTYAYPEGMCSLGVSDATDGTVIHATQDALATASHSTAFITARHMPTAEAYDPPLPLRIRGGYTDSTVAISLVLKPQAAAGAVALGSPLIGQSRFTKTSLTGRFIR